jgi:nitrite reductase/ring-hydroxylating ferredoxin subunit
MKSVDSSETKIGNPATPSTSLKHDYDIGPAEEFMVGTHHIVEINGRSVGIYSTDGGMYAVLNRCPHALAPICLQPLSGTFLPSAPGEISYGMNNLILRCGWHAWEYDVRTGEAIFGTDRRRLATFPVAVVDGRVLVTMRARSKDDEQS